MTPKDIKGILKFKGNDGDIKNKVEIIFANLPKRDSVDMGAMTSVEKFKTNNGFRGLNYSDTRLDTEKENEKKSILEDLNSINTEINTWWVNNKEKISYDSDSTQAKNKKTSKILNTISIVSLGVCIGSLFLGIVASLYVEDKDTLFFAIEGSKDIWNNIINVLTIILPTSAATAGGTTCLNNKQKDIKAIKENRRTLIILSWIGIFLSCIVVVFRPFGRYTPIVATILFAIFIIISIICLISLLKYDGVDNEEK